MGTFITTKNEKVFRHSGMGLRDESYYYTYFKATGNDVFKDTSGSTYTTFEMISSNTESSLIPQVHIARYMLNLPCPYNSSGGFGALCIGYSTSNFTEDSYVMDGVNNSLTITTSGTITSSGGTTLYPMNVLYTITNNTGSDVTVNVLYIYNRGYGYNDTPQRKIISNFLTGIYTFDPLTIPKDGSITVKVDN